MNLDPESVLQYLQLLHKWNKSYNLTAIREPERMLSEHVFSSLTVMPYLAGIQCLDIGSGAGIPGLILALARPDTEWVLLDSNGKKTRFLNQAKIELGLSNVEVIQERIEDYAADRLFSTIISRAWCALPEFYQASAQRLSKEGVMLAMKAGKPRAEFDAVLKLTQSVHYHELSVPGLAETKGLVVMQKDS